MWNFEKSNVQVNTGIEEVKNENINAATFDLAGRRLSEITSPGIYIIDGKKVLK